MNTFIYLSGILLMLLIWFLNGNTSTKFKIKLFALVVLLISACFFKDNIILLQYSATLLLLFVLNNLKSNGLSNPNLKGKINVLLLLWLMDLVSMVLNWPLILRVPVFSLLAQLVSIVYLVQFRNFSSELSYILGIFVFNCPRLMEVLGALNF